MYAYMLLMTAYILLSYTVTLMWVVITHHWIWIGYTNLASCWSYIDIKIIFLPPLLLLHLEFFRIVKSVQVHTLLGHPIKYRVPVLLIKYCYRVIKYACYKIRHLSIISSVKWRSIWHKLWKFEILLKAWLTTIW